MSAANEAKLRRRFDIAAPLTACPGFSAKDILHPAASPAPQSRGRRGFEDCLQLHPQTDHSGSRVLDCLHCVGKFLAVIKDMKFLDLAFLNHVIMTSKAV